MNKEECRTVRIVVHRFGDVKESFLGDVLKILDDCYSCVGARDLEIVDLCLFDRSTSMNAFISEEKKKFGISTSAFEASFFAVHDAWQGTPRIMVAHDKMLTAPKLVAIGGLHHEVAHTILHGSLEYYLFPTPRLLVKLENEGIFSTQFVRDILYLASLAVKDFEVTRLLYRNGYVEDQVAYNTYFLEPSEEEHETWRLAEKNKTARLLVLVSLLKTACCAEPLLRDERHGKEIAQMMARSMNYLPVELSAPILRMLKVTSKFGEKTHENVNLFMNKIIDEFIIEGGCFDFKGNQEGSI